MRMTGTAATTLRTRTTAGSKGSLQPLPTPNDVRDRLEAVLSGALSRAEVSRWAVDQRIGLMLRRDMPDSIAEHALYALAAALECEEDLSRTGSPYFIRDHDLAEWIANLDRRPAPPTEPVQLIRAWQARAVFDGPVIALPGSLSEYAECLSLPTYRGVDQLDDFEELLFVLPSGRQAAVRRYPRSWPHSDVLLECDSESASAAAAELLRVLDVRPSDVVWWNRLLFPDRSGSGN